jgi:hypothetical protein
MVKDSHFRPDTVDHSAGFLRGRGGKLAVCNIIQKMSFVKRVLYFSGIGKKLFGVGLGGWEGKVGRRSFP